MTPTPTDEDIELLKIFSRIPDPRVESKNFHLVVDLIMITICAVLSGADDWVAVAEYGKRKESWLREFLSLPYGIPSHDTFGRFFSMLDPHEFEKCFIQFMEILHKCTQGDVVAIDGKTIRGSFNQATGDKAIHVVSAWSTANGMSLGQMKVDSKTNEITVAPELIKRLALKGCIVTGDAMNAQKTITKAVIDQDGDYVFALKGNQGEFYENVKEFMDDVADSPNKDYLTDFSEETDKGHGRIEIRQCWSCSDFSWLPQRQDWQGLKSIAMVQSTRIMGEKSTCERRYYICSIEANAHQTNRVVRAHWGIENQLHWSLDVVFKEDLSRIRVGYAAENFSRARKIALTLLKNHKTPKQMSVKGKRASCGWDDKFLGQVLSGAGQQF